MGALKFKEFFKRNRFGIFFPLLGCAFFSVSTVLCASIVSTVGASYISCTKFLFQAGMMIPFILRNPESLCEPKMEDWLFGIGSGISLVISVYLCYISYLYIPIMDSSVIYNSLPVYVFIISGIWLKEKVNYVSMIILGIILLGVFLVCQPTFLFEEKDPADYSGLSMSWKGYLYVTIGSISAAVVLCFIKRIESTSTVVVLLIQGLIGAPISIVASFILNDSHDPKDSTEMLSLISAAIVSTIGRGLITFSLTLEDSTIVSLLCTTEILFTSILQIVIFKIFPNLPEIFGAILVVFGVIGIKLKDKMDFMSCIKGKISKNISDEEAKPLIK